MAGTLTGERGTEKERVAVGGSFRGVGGLTGGVGEMGFGAAVSTGGKGVTEWTIL